MIYDKNGKDMTRIQAEILRQHSDGTFKVRRLDQSRKEYCHVEPKFIHHSGLDKMPENVVNSSTISLKKRTSARGEATTPVLRWRSAIKSGKGARRLLMLLVRTDVQASTNRRVAPNAPRWPLAASRRNTPRHLPRRQSETPHEVFSLAPLLVRCSSTAS
mmetsp:Transcript_17849/g.54577  ORF Transcript_17849/g.54577 Transcript_17849/m.54577 type:complete len:160 (+) Transcript_17849:2867-3346(+)